MRAFKDSRPLSMFPGASPEFIDVAARFMASIKRLGRFHPDTVALGRKALALAPDWVHAEIVSDFFDLIRSESPSPAVH